VTGERAPTRLAEYEGAPELEGVVVYEPGWYLLEIPADQGASLVSLLDTLDVAVKPSTRLHVSIVKGEAPSRSTADWGVAFVNERVKVRYNPVLRDENGLHLWVDCHSPRLCEMREHFGLTTLRRDDGAYLVNFHLTVGRRVKAIERRPGPHLRLSPQSHLHAETGMQHL
jgi:hypothetical protein